MRQITKNLGQSKISKVLLKNALLLELPYLQRSKSRQVVTLQNGEEVLLVLHRGSVMRGNDVLVDDQGQFILVKSAPEKVMRVTAQNPFLLMRAGYHLGNRHIPVEISDNYLQLEFDPVLSDMLKKLGVHVELVDQPFEPENGAYGGGHKHGHDATFAEDYALAQSAYHAHDHQCNHDHEH
jgi:urease accessory protein